MGVDGLEKIKKKLNYHFIIARTDILLRYFSIALLVLTLVIKLKYFEIFFILLPFVVLFAIPNDKKVLDYMDFKLKIAYQLFENFDYYKENGYDLERIYEYLRRIPEPEYKFYHLKTFLVSLFLSLTVFFIPIKENNFYMKINYSYLSDDKVIVKVSADEFVKVYLNGKYLFTSQDKNFEFELNLEKLNNCLLVEGKNIRKSLLIRRREKLKVKKIVTVIYPKYLSKFMNKKSITYELRQDNLVVLRDSVVKLCFKFNRKVYLNKFLMPTREIVIQKKVEKPEKISINVEKQTFEVFIDVKEDMPPKLYLIKPKLPVVTLKAPGTVEVSLKIMDDYGLDSVLLRDRETNFIFYLSSLSNKGLMTKMKLNKKVFFDLDSKLEIRIKDVSNNEAKLVIRVEPKFYDETANITKQVAKDIMQTSYDTKSIYESIEMIKNTYSPQKVKLYKKQIEEKLKKLAEMKKNVEKKLQIAEKKLEKFKQLMKYQEKIAEISQLYKMILSDKDLKDLEKYVKLNDIDFKNVTGLKNYSSLKEKVKMLEKISHQLQKLAKNKILEQMLDTLKKLKKLHSKHIKSQEKLEAMKKLVDSMKKYVDDKKMKQALENLSKALNDQISNNNSSTEKQVQKQFESAISQLQMQLQKEKEKQEKITKLILKSFYSSLVLLGLDQQLLEAFDILKKLLRGSNIVVKKKWPLFEVFAVKLNDWDIFVGRFLNYIAALISENAMYGISLGKLAQQLYNLELELRNYVKNYQPDKIYFNLILQYKKIAQLSNYLMMLLKNSSNPFKSLMQQFLQSQMQISSALSSMPMPIPMQMKKLGQMQEKLARQMQQLASLLSWKKQLSSLMKDISKQMNELSKLLKEGKLQEARRKDKKIKENLLSAIKALKKRKSYKRQARHFLGEEKKYSVKAVGDIEKEDVLPLKLKLYYMKCVQYED